MAEQAPSWFHEYMENFKKELSLMYPLRQVCDLKHQALDARLKAIDGDTGRLAKGEAQFKGLDRRIASLERRMYAGLVVFGAFQIALQNGWLRL